MPTTTAYAIKKTVHLQYDEALARTREALQKEGFGVLTEIDIREKMREKLGVEMPRQIILGACNPPLAYKALQAEEDIGLLLPCNVVVYEVPGGCVVAAMDPDAMMSVTNNFALREVAAEARTRLERVIASV